MTPSNGNGHDQHVAYETSRSNDVLTIDASDDLSEVETNEVVETYSPDTTIDDLDVIPLRVEAEAPPEIRHLMVVVERGANPEQDKRRLERVFGTLISFHGIDAFAITLSGNDDSIELDFPNDTTQVCDELIERLSEIVGPTGIHIA